MKKAKKLLAIVLSLIFALSAFSIAASASNAPILKHPTTENPMTFSYIVNVTAYDKYGRAKDVGYSNDYNEGVTEGNRYAYVMDFYPSKADYQAKKTPIASIGFDTKNGQATVIYKDIFVKDPPASLYFHMRPKADTFFSPASGTVRPQ